MPYQFPFASSIIPSFQCFLHKEIYVSLNAVKLSENSFIAFCTDVSEKIKTQIKLNKKMLQLESFAKIAVGREKRIKELKNVIQELKKTKNTRLKK